MGINFDSEFQAPITGTITAVSQIVDFTTINEGTKTVQVTGTWVGILVAEVSNDGSIYTTLSIINNDTTVPSSSITVNGIYIIPSNSYGFIRIRSSAWTSGTATINGYGSDSASSIITNSFLRGADGTQIGNTSDKLKVDASLSGSIVPTITNKLRFRLNTSNTTVVAAYTSLFSRSGTGLLFGFQAAFNSDNIRIKLTIDSGIVFEDTLVNFKNFQINDTTAGRIQMGGFLSTIGNVFDFSSRFAIPYDSNIDISVQRSDGTNHQNNNWLVILTEDT